MSLPNGHYRTPAGSNMRISGDHGGISKVEFDWVEEGACPDCVPAAYEVDGMLVWHCEQCGGGQAQLLPVEDHAPALTFDEFNDQVEEELHRSMGWSQFEVADFMSPRTRHLIQAFRDGTAVADTARLLQDIGPKRDCDTCHGAGEYFGHADGCADELCALNGDIHSCAGQVLRCACSKQRGS